jgi:hypothetical protein
MIHGPYNIMLWSLCVTIRVLYKNTNNISVAQNTELNPPDFKVNILRAPYGHKMPSNVRNMKLCSKQHSMFMLFLNCLWLMSNDVYHSGDRLRALRNK